MREVDRLVRDLAGLEPAGLHERLRLVIDRLSVPERFELLHRLGVYHHPESLSGAGSTLSETAALRGALPRLIEEEGVGSVLDIPCGDFHWMRTVELDVDYTGADIVREIVSANQGRHASTRRRFLVLDAMRDRLPSVDLVLCRDLLIHLSLEDCRAVLANFVASGSRLLLTTHFARRTANPDIVSGDFRPVNLCGAPFRFPAPIRVIAEQSALGAGAFDDRAMALWRIADLRERIASGMKDA